MSLARGERFPLSVSRHLPTSLPSQIVEQVRALIETGIVRAGDPLPSSRGLASQLNVSRGTVVFAYEQLAGEGYLEADAGGTRVARTLHLPPVGAGSTPSTPPAQLPRSEPGMGTAGTGSLGAGDLPGATRPSPAVPSSERSEAPINLLPGAPDTSLLATTGWRSAWRRAAANPATGHPAAGSPELRTHLAEHLRLTRSVVRSPDDVLVTAGAREGFRLVLSALRRRLRHRPLRIAVEDPGYPSLRRIPLAFGHIILPIKVDKDGLNPDLLPTGDSRPDLVLVAPSHQYPLGASMPATRRLELVEWARTHDAFILEDDYDSELRYTGEPLPALAAMDRPAHSAHPGSGGDRVITLGSFARVLTPGLSLGYLVMPRQLRGDLLSLRADLGAPVPALVQDAMADFLAQGGVRRHIARMRRVYRGRRALVVEQLSGLPGTEILPMDGGLHAVLRVHAGAQAEAQLVEGAARAGVLVAPLAAYWSASGGGGGSVGAGALPPVHGVVLGFGGVSDRKLVQGLTLLKTAVRGADVKGSSV